MLKQGAKQFCLNTTLHGYKFVVLPNRILLERVFWIVVVILALIGAIVLLFIAWFSFQEHPTFKATDSTHYPIWNYPFPGVTVCDYNKISKKKAFALAAKLSDNNVMNGLTTDELAWELRLLFQLIHNNNPEVPLMNYTRLEDILDHNKLSPHEALKIIAPSCDELLVRCKWKGEERRCDSLFEQIQTPEGFCCSFNYFALKNHNFPGESSAKAPKKARRVSACGYQTALEVLSNTNPEDYFAAKINSFGTTILIHNPYNYPEWSAQAILTDTKSLNLIGVSPTITISTEDIRNTEIKKRKCLFPRERDLFNFKHYNYQNCLIECRMNVTKKLCNCIPFYFVNPNGTYPNTRICSLKDLECLREHRLTIYSSVPGFDFKNLPDDHEYGTEQSDCDCILSCDYCEYIADASSGQLSRNYSINQLNLYGGISLKEHSVFRVFFNDLVGIKNRRDLQFSWHTLLAYYGGLLGLFIGFSFVSAVEIVYFFTIRLIINALRPFNGKKKLFNPVKLVKPYQLNKLDLKLLTKEIKIRRRSNNTILPYLD